MWLEDVDAFADKVPEAGDCSLADLSEHGFETREGLLDRIEVGTIGRQEAECCTGRFDPFAHRVALVARQIVHDDDVAGPQFGHEDLSDIGLEPLAIDGAIKHHRRDHP